MRNKFNIRKQAILCWSTLYLFSVSTSLGATPTRLLGGGATLPTEIYEAWLPAYDSRRRPFKLLNMEYQSLGSGLGKQIFRNGHKLDYSSTDATLEAFSEDPDFRLAPILVAPVVLGYKLPGVESLVLSRDQIVGIYNGTLNSWNDPWLQETNPNVTFPNRPIRVVARADKSGTTEIFTRALSAFSQEWNQTFGIFNRGLNETDDPIHWDPRVISLYGRTTRGVSGAILSYRFSIGYLSVAEARVAQIPWAKVINKAGFAVNPNVSAIEETMIKRLPPGDDELQVDLVDDNDTYSYPILGLNFFLIHLSRMKNCDTAVELFRYAEWIFFNNFAREDSSEMFTVVVTRALANRAMNNVFRKMQCQGQSVYQLVLKQKTDEWWSQQSWVVPVLVASPLLVILILFLFSYIGWQKIKFRRALLSDEWKIDIEKINIKWSRQWDKNPSPAGAGGPGSSVSVTMSNISSVSYAMTQNMFAVGTLNEKPVCMRDMLLRTIYLNRADVKRTLLWFREKCQHANVLRFYGLSMIDGQIFLVSENAPKGTLSDVVQNDKYRIDDNIKFSLAIDIVCGMQFIHNQGLVHGYLTSESCLIDQKWNVKVADWEYNKLMKVQNQSRFPRKTQIEPIQPLAEKDENIVAKAKYWTAPELLRNGTFPNKPSDMYSAAIILVEIFTREDPFTDLSESRSPVDIIELIINKNLRPSLDNVGTDSVKMLIKRAWDSDPEKRPSFSQVRRILLSSRPSRKSIMDCMMESLEGYVTHLEEKVAERTMELATANKNTENLLHQILPPEVATALSRGESVEPESFESVTIFFSDIVGFTNLASSRSPMEIVNFLNDLYTVFDETIRKHEVYKVETIGDAYMVVSGLPKRNGILHARHICGMALDLVGVTNTISLPGDPSSKVEIRAGIHSGPVVAGIVGTKMPRYCLFGDTVNTASRMESTSLPMCIQISQNTAQLLDQLGGFQMQTRGSLEIKGKGVMRTSFLLKKSDASSPVEQSYKTETVALKIEPTGSLLTPNEPVYGHSVIGEQTDGLPKSEEQTDGQLKSDEQTRGEQTSFKQTGGQQFFYEQIGGPQMSETVALNIEPTDSLLTPDESVYCHSVLGKQTDGLPKSEEQTGGQQRSDEQIGAQQYSYKQKGDEKMFDEQTNGQHSHTKK